MFKEIAVDPAAVATSYRDFSYIVEKFGLAEGRLIAAFPAKWKALVHRAAHQRLSGTVELSKVQERLRRLESSVFYSRGRPGPAYECAWLQSVIEEHRRLPFDAVITSTPCKEQGFVNAGDLDGEHPCLHSNSQWNVERTPEVMGECCAPLIGTGRHIKLIDPHFDAGQPRFRGPFLAFLDKRRDGATVDVFRNDHHDGYYIASRIARTIVNIRRQGGTLRLFLRPKGLMHNRFVLSEFGGVSFQIGLDQDHTGERPRDLVSVLELGPWRVEWEAYSGDDCVAQFDI